MRLLMLASLALTIAALAPATAGAHNGRGVADAVLSWNDAAGRAAVAACISPVGPSPAEARMYAMTQIAVHDALNAIDRRFEPYAYDGRAARGADAAASVAAASHDVLVPVLRSLSTLVSPACIDAAVAGVEADYATALGAVSEPRARRLGVAVGRASAAAILAARAGDRAQELLAGDPAYPQSTVPGGYRFTPNAPFAFAPRLGEMPTFVLRDSAQFRPGPPPAVTGAQFARDLNEIKALGGDGVTTPSARTADQTQIALFWLESSPLQWSRVTRIAATAVHFDGWETARLLGLVEVALADGYIASFETKYLYNYWRPVTAIREAAGDGNPATVADPTWTPLVDTPPVPDYDSAHAVEGAAAAGVLRRVLGDDRSAFSTCSTTLPEGARCGQPASAARSYASFSDAASENGMSRILIGFHFRTAVEVGLRHGDRIARRAVRRAMQPAYQHHHG